MHQVDTMRLDLPAEWKVVPVTGSEIDEFVRTQLDQEHWDALSVVERRQSENLLRKLGRDLRSQRCEIAAVYAEIFEHPSNNLEENGEPASRLLSATVVLSIVRRERTRSLLDLTPDVLLQASLMPLKRDLGYTELELPELVALSAGRAVRTRRLHDVGNTKLFIESFMFSVEPDFENICVLQFATPSIEFSSDFSALFFAIAETFALYREGDATPA